jgi:hypothetical protein
MMMISWSIELDWNKCLDRMTITVDLDISMFRSSKVYLPAPPILWLATLTGKLSRGRRLYRGSLRPYHLVPYQNIFLTTQSYAYVSSDHDVPTKGQPWACTCFLLDRWGDEWYTTRYYLAYALCWWCGASGWDHSWGEQNVWTMVTWVYHIGYSTLLSLVRTQEQVHKAYEAQ